MPKRSRTPPRDENKAAKRVVDRIIARTEDEAEAAPDKDPAAVALGRKGGKKGGPARAANMTPEERAESARKAARARWSERKPKP